MLVVVSVAFSVALFVDLSVAVCFVLSLVLSVVLSLISFEISNVATDRNFNTGLFFLYLVCRVFSVCLSSCLLSCLLSCPILFRNLQRSNRRVSFCFMFGLLFLNATTVYFILLLCCLR
jgi:hypothetical protein